MKVEINDTDVKVMSIREVAEQMMNESLTLGERMGDIELDEDELNVAVVLDEPMDVRVHGCTDRWETFGLADIAKVVTDYAHLQWAKDEDGADILLCFGRKEILSRVIAIYDANGEATYWVGGNGWATKRERNLAAVFHGNGAAMQTIRKLRLQDGLLEPNEKIGVLDLETENFTPYHD